MVSGLPFIHVWSYLMLCFEAVVKVTTRFCTLYWRSIGDPKCSCCSVGLHVCMIGTTKQWSTQTLSNIMILLCLSWPHHIRLFFSLLFWTCFPLLGTQMICFCRACLGLLRFADYIDFKVSICTTLLRAKYSLLKQLFWHGDISMSYIAYKNAVYCLFVF